MRRYRLHAALTALVLVISGLAFGALPAGAAPADDAGRAESRPGRLTEADLVRSVPENVRAEMAAQWPLSQASNDIQAAIERAGTTGFSGIAIRGKELVVWWKAGSAVPAPVATAIETARRTVPLRMEKAPHSLAELKAASNRIAAQIRGSSASPLHTIEIPVEGSGLVVGVDDRVATATAAATRAVRAAKVDVPVRTVARERPTFAGRLNDASPFRGGARLYHSPTGGQCTTGFTVAGVNGTFLLTAAHCGRVGDTYLNGDLSRFVGTAEVRNTFHDIMLIRQSGDVAASIYDGGVGVGEFTKLVRAYARTTPGEHVCISASFTGAVCEVYNSSNMSATLCGTDIYGAGQCSTDLVFAGARSPFRRICQPGDSGGPIFTVIPTGVIAKGTLSGCGGLFTLSNIYYQDVFTTLADFAVSPLLAP